MKVFIALNITAPAVSLSALLSTVSNQSDSTTTTTTTTIIIIIIIIIVIIIIIKKEYACVASIVTKLLLPYIAVTDISMQQVRLLCHCQNSHNNIIIHGKYITNFELNVQMQENSYIIIDKSKLRFSHDVKYANS